jgi:hypothetical protein
MIALMRNCWKFSAIQLSSARSSRPKNIANADEITQQIAALKSRLAALDRERSEIAERLSALEHVCAADAAAQRFPVFARVTMSSPTADKMALFRSLFRGRDDVFPHRWENPKSGKAGYSPVCRNEWVRGVCGKPQVKCRECANQAFVPFDENIVRSHLAGRVSGSSRDFTAGMPPDETCWFVVADFDETSWRRDVSAFRDTARSNGVPVAVERSRSGHAWIFFTEPVSVSDARRLGALLVTATGAGAFNAIGTGATRESFVRWG